MSENEETRFVPLKNLARVITSSIDKKTEPGEPSIKLCNYTDVYYNNEITSKIDFMAASATPDQIKKFEVTAGDVPFTKDSETANDIGIPSYVPETLPGVAYGYHLSILKPKDGVSGKYLFYYLMSSPWKNYLEQSVKGITRVSLNQGTIKNASLKPPPPPVASTTYCRVPGPGNGSYRQADCRPGKRVSPPQGEVASHDI